MVKDVVPRAVDALDVKFQEGMETHRQRDVKGRAILEAMRAVVVHDQKPIDVQHAAVVARAEKRIASGLVDIKLARPGDADVVAIGMEAIDRRRREETSGPT